MTCMQVAPSSTVNMTGQEVVVGQIRDASTAIAFEQDL
jgi:hypothetical protein